MSDITIKHILVGVGAICLYLLWSRHHRPEAMTGTINRNLEIQGGVRSSSLTNVPAIRRIVFTNQAAWFMDPLIPSYANDPAMDWVQNTTHGVAPTWHMLLTRVYALDSTGRDLIRKPLDGMTITASKTMGTHFNNTSPTNLLSYYGQIKEDGSVNAEDLAGTEHGCQANGPLRLQIDLGKEVPVAMLGAYGLYHDQYWHRNNGIRILCYNDANELVHNIQTDHWNSSLQWYKYYDLTTTPPTLFSFPAMHS